MNKINGNKAGELFDKAKAALDNATVRLLRRCGEENYRMSPHRVKWCRTERYTVRGEVLQYNGKTYEIQRVHRARAGDLEGDPKLVCYKVVEAETRDFMLLVFGAP